MRGQRIRRVALFVAALIILPLSLLVGWGLLFAWRPLHYYDLDPEAVALPMRPMNNAEYAEVIGDHPRPFIVRIENVGGSTAHKGVAILRNKTGREIFLKKGRIEFSDLGPDENEEVVFTFDVRDGVEAEEVDEYECEVVIYDSYSGESLSLPIPAAASYLTLATGSNGPDASDHGNFANPVIIAGSPEPEGVGPFLRGDSNADGVLNISDPSYILTWLFKSGPEPTCVDAADSDDNGEVNMTDAVAVFARLFTGGGPHVLGEDCIRIEGCEVDNCTP